MTGQPQHKSMRDLVEWPAFRVLGIIFMLMNGSVVVSMESTKYCTKETIFSGLSYRHRSIQSVCKNSIEMYVNHLDSKQTVIPYDYHKFDFCQLSPEVHQSENLGQVVFGDRISLSPYNFTFKEEHDCVVVCEKTYNPNIQEQTQKLHSLLEAVMLDYQQHWIIDDLPVLWCTNSNTRNDWMEYCSSMFPVGCYVDKQGVRQDACVIDVRFNQKDTFYLFNHVHFDIKHGWTSGEDGDVREIVAISINLDSIDHGKNDGRCNAFSTTNGHSHNQWPFSQPMAIPADFKDPITIKYTFSVRFSDSGYSEWSYRWRHILGTLTVATPSQLFSILTPLMVIFLLTAALARIMLRNFYKGSACNCYSHADTIYESRWKLIHGDVFRPPHHIMLLSVLLGSGAQIFCVTFITLVFACLGILSPAKPGSLGTCLIALYACCGVVAGYVSARTYQTFGGKKWKFNLILTCFLIPGIVFAIVIMLNFLHLTKQSSAAIPSSTFAALLAMWFGVMVPLMSVGALYGLIKKPIQLPGVMDQVPRVIPKQSFYKHPLLNIVMGGVLPFLCSYTQTNAILTSIWSHEYYNMFGTLFFVAVFLVIICSEATVVLCYFHLRSENYHWWWRSFLTSGFTAVYLLIYCLHYLVSTSSIHGAVNVILYFGYTSIMVLLFFLFTGAIGFFACFRFVVRLYATVDPQTFPSRSDNDLKEDVEPDNMNFDEDNDDTSALVGISNVTVAKTREDEV